MPVVSNISFNVKYNLTGAPALVLTDTSTYPAGAVGIFDITQPNGYTRSGNFATPDINSSGGTFSFPLTLSSTGGVQCGTYKVVYQIKTPDSVVSTFTREYQFTYSPVSIDIRLDFDIFTPQLYATDITSYQVGGYNNTSPSKSWTATSVPTGTLTSISNFIDLQYNGEYYDAEYDITLASSLTYQHQTLAWLSIDETISSTVEAEACTPLPLDELIPMLEELRQKSIECNGDFPDFEKAQTLFSHLMDMVKMIIIGGTTQEGVFDVYNDLLFVLRNNQYLPCVHTNLPIQPYDLSQYTDTHFDNEASFCTVVGDGNNATFTIEHNLNDDCVVVQVYDYVSKSMVLTDVSIYDKDNIIVSFNQAPSINQYLVVIHSGATNLKGREIQLQNNGTYIQWRYQGDVAWTNLVALSTLIGPVGPTGPQGPQGNPGVGLASGGTTGQLLRKASNTNYDTEWFTAPYVVTEVDPVFTASPAGTITNTNKSNWNTAYSWGDHATAGYLTTALASTTYVALAGSYNNPAWITSLAWSKITGAPAFITTEVDPVFTASAAFNVTNTKISNWDTAFSWGNHAIAGYLQQATANTLYVSLNGSYSNPVWITSLAWSKISGKPTSLSGYGIIDAYTSSQVDTLLNSYVPESRTLTINGSTYDLSANRSWIIPPVSDGDYGDISVTGIGTIWTIDNKAVTYSKIQDVTNNRLLGRSSSGSGVVQEITIGSNMSLSGGVLSATGFQNPISLTTTGNSGAATFSSNVLNIPNYTISGIGGVPSTRNITINGTTYDLSTDRSWTITTNSGTVTSVGLTVPTGLSVTGAPVTTSGTLAISYASGYAIPTTVKQGNWDDAYTFVSNFPSQAGNSGKYLTTNGSSLSWGTINLSGYVPTSRTITINGTTYDLTVNRSWTINESDTLDSVTDRGATTTNNITIGGITSNVGGTTIFSSEANYFYSNRISSSGAQGFKIKGYGTDLSFWRYDDGTGFVEFGNTQNYGLKLYTNNTAQVYIHQSGNLSLGNSVDASYKLDVTGQVRISTLSGTGNRMVVADSSGVLSTQAIPSGGSAYTVTSVSTTYTETATSGTKIIKADTTSGTFTINLPTAVGNTATIIIKKVAGSASLTLDGSGSQTIDGGATASIVKINESVTLVSDNSNWQII